ncbi:aryl-sulfate sulfotransferase [Limibacter armeniacum]|uniref:aryl-sulfate sulfotransferase n=1 Tax=Limibacter armeniacum TaxID=466084 RepID=UPI002FE68550
MKKLLLISLCLFLIGSIVTSCDDDDDNSNSGPNPQPSTGLGIDDTKDSLTSNEEKDILVTTVDTVGETTTIEFENGNSIESDETAVDSTVVDEDNWQITFYFSDGTQQTVGYLGSEEAIEVSGITLNPSGYAPLTATAKVSTPVKGNISIRVVGQNGQDSDILHDFVGDSTTWDLDILGLYPAYDNTVEIVFSSGEGDERAVIPFTVTTGELPEGMPEIDVTTMELDEMAEGLTLVSYRAVRDPNIPFMMDAFGDIRWYFDFTGQDSLGVLNYGNGVEVLQNGNLYFGDVASNAIYEVDRMGFIVDSWKLSGYGFHHQVLEKPNGDFLVLVNKDGSVHDNGKPTIEDVVIEIDRESKEIINEWDLKESLDEYRTALVNELDEEEVDWFHANAIVYDESDNTIIVSGRVQGLVKLTEDNEVVWILAPHRGWGQNKNGVDMTQYLLTPLDADGNEIMDAEVLDGAAQQDDFDWNWYQHAPLITPQGTIMIFDNGDNRNFMGRENPYSRAVEFMIDEENMTVQQLWEYGKERGEATFSRLVSDVDFLSESDNVLFVPGWGAVNAAGEGGKVVEVDYTTKEVVYEVEITSSESAFAMHRAERLSLYPSEE